MAVITRAGDQAALVLVAADGAGTAECAAEGAALACATFLEAVSPYLAEGGSALDVTRPQVDAWISAVRDQMQVQAEAAGRPLRDYACTFLAAVLDETGLVGLQVGDGAIVLADGAGYRPLFWPQRGEYANMTTFITEDASLNHLAMKVLPDVPDEVALLTDGLQSLALTYATQGAHTAFFTPMFAPLRAMPRPGEATELDRQLSEFLNSSAIARRTDDDKTLVLATRRAPSPITHVPPVTAAAASPSTHEGTATPETETPLAASPSAHVGSEDLTDASPAPSEAEVTPAEPA